jgi:hypothetical protein
MTCSPSSPAIIASSAVRQILPQAAPGEAGSPSPIGVPASSVARRTWKNSASSAGSMQFSAAATASPFRADWAARTAVAIVVAMLSLMILVPPSWLP